MRRWDARHEVIRRAHAGNPAGDLPCGGKATLAHGAQLHWHVVEGVQGAASSAAAGARPSSAHAAKTCRS